MLATVIALAVLHRCQRNGFPFNAKETQVCKVGQGKGRSWLGRAEGGGDTNYTTEESWEGKPIIYILFMEDTHTHTHTHTENVFDSALFIWNAYARMNQTKEHYHA